jgi:hypothetical protein
MSTFNLRVEYEHEYHARYNRTLASNTLVSNTAFLNYIVTI